MTQPPRPKTPRSGYARLKRSQEARKQGETRKERQERFAPKAKPEAAPVPYYLYGLHAVAAALANPDRRVHKLMATPNGLGRLPEPPPPTVPVETVRPNALDAFTGPDAVHQGLVALVEPLPERTLAEPLPKFSVILDQVTDPHNVGAILRSAAAFGAQGVISTNRHAARETATLAKSASGALELVPMLTVRNLAEAIETLKAAGTFVVGLEGTGERDLPTALAAANPGAPLALVMGSEGKGLRQKTLATCSAVARLPLTSPQLASLNVSNAAVLALYIAQTHQAAEG